MCSRIVLILVMCTFIIQSTVLYASTKKPGATAANFLKLGIGARPVGLGEAFCAVADDVNAAYWNPAGLAQVNEFQLTAIHKNWFEDIRGGYLGYLHPADKGAIAVSMTYLDEGSMQEIKKDRTVVGTFKAEDMGVTVSFAQALRKELLIGANLKYIHQKIADTSGMGFAGDMGLIYKPTQFVNLGLVVQNIGPKIKFVNEGFSLPLTLKTGISYKNKGIILALDINKPIDNDPMICMGVELNIGNMIAVRLGYRYQTKNQKLDLYESAPVGLTGGLGLGFGNTYFLDYAYVPYGDLGDTHRIAFMMKLVPVEVPAEKVVPPIEVPEIPPEEKPKVIPEEKPKVEEIKPVPIPEIVPEIKPEVKPEVKPEAKPPEVVPEKPKEIIPIKPPELLLKLKPPVKEPPQPIVPKKQVIVLMDEVAIWSGPGATYDKITTVHKGTKLMLLDDSKQWYYKVLLPDGTVGWVCYVFVSK
ncbi:MAG: PorV/PorQ family protein [bacterium]